MINEGDGQGSKPALQASCAGSVTPVLHQGDVPELDYWDGLLNH